MGVCVRVRVARVVRVSEGTLPTIVNTLRSSKEPLGTIRRNPNYPPPGLAQTAAARAAAAWQDWYEARPKLGVITKKPKITLRDSLAELSLDPGSVWPGGSENLSG